MSHKYRNFPAIGQMNDQACWAACLKWWLHAVKSIDDTQQHIWDGYERMRNPEGGMSDSGMIFLIRGSYMYCEKSSPASDFTISVIKERLKYSPLYVAYTESSSHKRHVNVIYEATGNHDYNARLRVMEPQAIDNGDGSFTGQHLRKSINDFNILGTVFMGSLRNPDAVE